MIGLAVVGVGWAGRRQAEAVAELGSHEDPSVSDRIRVVLLVDNDADHLEAEAKALGVGEYVTDLARALAHPDVDAVSIATPHKYHADHVLASVRSGMHTMVEKPMATDVVAASEMIAAADENEVTLYVAENEVYTSFVDTTLDLLPEIGQPIHGSIRGPFRKEGNHGYPGRRNWLTRPEEGGTGQWALNGIHTVAQLRAILGEVDTVYMREHHAESFAAQGIEGTMVGLLAMSDGPLVDIVQTAEFSLGMSLVIHGDRGTIHVTKDYIELSGDSEHRVDLPTDGLSSYARELLAFADHLEGRQEGPTDGRSGLRSLAVVQAGYESAAAGMPINLAERFGDI